VGGPPWQMSSPITPPDQSGHPTPPAGQIIGSGIAVATSYTSAVYKLFPEAGKPLLHTTLQGIARLSPTYNYTALDDQWFCAGAGSCKCPKAEEGEVPPNRPLLYPALLALTGDPNSLDGTVMTLTAHSLDDFCHKKQKKKPSNPGSDNGDPYMTTF